jgi:hypothetical protein
MSLAQPLAVKLGAALSLAVVSLTLSLPPVSAQLPANTPALTAYSGPCSRTWEVLPSPNTGNMGSYLAGVSAISGDDVWAAGYSYTWNAGSHAQVQHWDGNTWSLTPDPEGYSRAFDVEALPSGDVWIVGDGAGGQGLIDRWDGTQWEPISHPHPGSYSNTFCEITTLASNDVWVVGDNRSSYNTPHSTLVERWDGTQWSVVPSPNAGTNGSYLFDIAAISSDNAWAVGYYYDGSVTRTLIEHWDGVQWAIIPSPNVGTQINILNGVTIAAPNDVWAVGYYDNEWASPDGMLIEHWDGAAWSVVVGPNLGDDNRLHDVISLGANDVWAVGEYGSINDSATLIIHWDGSIWSHISSPDMLGADILYGVDVDSAGTLWTVGKYGFIDGESTLVARALDPCVTPSPTVTGTPPTATQTRTQIPSRTPTATRTRTPTPTRTFTPVPPTATPTGTASVISSPTFTPIPPTAITTACTITFTDVDETNIFYPFIRCLACRGIISGYDDGTFRPYNDITKGQIAKIVSNSAGLDEDPGPQIYEDVPTDSPFYVWINRLSRRGHIGGYPCGLLPEEPCIEPDNMPYFRPSNSATRGQLAKIVANAAGVEGTPSAIIYSDVPEDHPFYVWIEAGVMSGYPCGAPGEPCNPQSQPFFRPFNNVTRGQASKIVANTFFPGCQTP